VKLERSPHGPRPGVSDPTFLACYITGWTGRKQQKHVGVSNKDVLVHKKKTGKLQ